jgi:hypothetical protein
MSVYFPDKRSHLRGKTNAWSNMFKKYFPQKFLRFTAKLFIPGHHYSFILGYCDDNVSFREKKL